jgi:hypothetical protein
VSARRRLALFCTGAAAFVSLHLLFSATWDEWFMPHELAQPWFLGSRRSARLSQLVLALLAFLTSLGGRRTWKARLAESAVLAGGAVAAMCTTFALLGAELLLTGPARLWPVALGAASLMLVLPIAAGTLASSLLSTGGAQKR